MMWFASLHGDLLILCTNSLFRGLRCSCEFASSLPCFANLTKFGFHLERSQFLGGLGPLLVLCLIVDVFSEFTDLGNHRLGSIPMGNTVGNLPWVRFR